MSIKDNVDYIKKELSTQEQFLEGFVKIERFYKKYKFLLFSILVAIVLGVIGFYIKSYFDEQNKIKSNIAFNKFLANNNDDVALKEIEATNRNLYEVALFIKAKSETISENITNAYLSSLLEYKNALEAKNVEALESLSSRNEFLLKDFALFDRALILTNEQKYQEARDIISLINKDTQIADLVAKLEHFLIAK